MTLFTFFDVTNGNPNGDPDNDNCPRVTDDNRGIVTHECLNRKVRNYVDVAKNGADGFKIHVRDNAVLCTEYEKHINKSHKDKTEEKKSAAMTVAKDYYDVRVFGGVFPLTDYNTSLTGPIQISNAMTYDEVTIDDYTITSVAVATEKERESKDHTMGRNHKIRYGLYCAKGHINPFRAEKVNMTEEDVDLYYKALENMFEFDRSGVRGEMVARKLIVFEHDDKLGNAPSYKLFDLVKVTSKKEYPTSFDDYEITIDGENLPKGVTIKEIF